LFSSSSPIKKALKVIPKEETYEDFKKTQSFKIVEQINQNFEKIELKENEEDPG